MKRVILFFGILLVGLTVFAQPKMTASPPAPKHGQMPQGPKDGPDGKPRPRRMMQRSDTLTLSDYMMSIERVNDKLNAIQDSARLGFESVHLGRELDDIADNVNLVRQNMLGRRSAVNIKSTYLFQSYATGLDNDNDRVRNRINQLYCRTYNANQSIKSIFRDSVFHDLFGNKIICAKLDKKLTRLEWKWSRTDSTVKANIDSLNALKVKAADNSMNLTDMLNMMDKKLDRAKPRLFGPEECCLWQVAKTDTMARDSTRKTLNILSGEHKAIGFYISQESGNKGFLLFLGAVLFIWLFFKRKLLKIIKSERTDYDFLHLKYLNNHPVMSILVVLLCLMPFFDVYAPTSYMTVTYTLLLAASTTILLKKEDQTFRFYWLIFAVLFLADAITYLLIEPTFVARLWMLAVHVAIIVFAYRFCKRLSKQRPYYKWIRSAMMIGIILSGLAVLFNIFGRFSLSGLLGLAGIFAITQALILPIFIDTVLEIILLQLLSSRLKKGIDHPFDCNVVIRKIKIPLLIVTVLLWLVLLTSNLNIYHNISETVVESLTSMRTLGSISFRLINVLWFFVIIWLAHISSKLVSFLFGEIGSEIDDMTSESKGVHSRLLILKLLIILGGYLLAIAASGLPIDKLTIIIGALGVGIGMGLQNVVNNFVSGIILIFDGSLKIGDDIEVSGQAGKVKEIGMRASTLSTVDGAEVIIPNGNILSQNIVNWTFSNDQKRVTLSFTLSGKELDANVVNGVINATLKKIPHVIAKRNPVILYTKVTDGSYTLTVNFWSTIKKADQVKSEALLTLNAAFTAMKIGFDASAPLKVVVTK